MDVHERLTRLEERLVHLQRHTEEQDKVMHGLSEELAKLRDELALFRLRASAQSSSSELPSDERPPHY